MGNEVIEQPFRLYQDDPVVAVANGVANTWSDIWTYQVPNGTAFILKPSHSFSAYIKDASAEVGSATCQVKIEKRDSSKSDVLVVYGPALYVESKEFQEKSKLARLMVPGEGVIINEREYLIISVKDDATVTEASCYFELHIAKIRKAIGA